MIDMDTISDGDSYQRVRDSKGFSVSKDEKLDLSELDDTLKYAMGNNWRDEPIYP